MKPILYALLCGLSNIRILINAFGDVYPLFISKKAGQL